MRGTNDYEETRLAALAERGAPLRSSAMKLALFVAVAFVGPLVGCGPTGHGGDGGADAGEPCPEGGTGDGDGGSPGVARTWTCSFSEPKFGPDTTHATNCSDTNLRVDVAYSAAETTSGDMHVTAIVDVPTNPPALSASDLWSAGTPQASLGAETLAHDICRSGGDQHAGTWTFTLDKTTSVLTSVYMDADLIAGQLAFTTPCSIAPLVE